MQLLNDVFYLYRPFTQSKKQYMSGVYFKKRRVAKIKLELRLPIPFPPTLNSQFCIVSGIFDGILVFYQFEPFNCF